MRHRQERWLHTRISGALEEALKREAERRRQPVSLLVRNVLERALDLVEDIVESGLEIADRAGRLGEGPRRPHLADVYGWQELILNRPTRCARCRAGVAAGGSAYRGLRQRAAGSPVFLCVTCVRRLRAPADRKEGV